MGDLLPCPFCEARMEDFHGQIFVHPLVENRDEACILSGLSFSYTHSRWGTDERLRWNRRALPAASSEDVRAGAQMADLSLPTLLKQTREDALKEAAAMVAAFGSENDVGRFGNKDHRATATYLSTRILALIPEAKP